MFFWEFFWPHFWCTFKIIKIFTSKNFESKNNPFKWIKARKQKESHSAEIDRMGYVSQFCHMSARWLKVIERNMLKNYLFNLFAPRSDPVKIWSRRTRFRGQVSMSSRKIHDDNQRSSKTLTRLWNFKGYDGEKHPPCNNGVWRVSNLWKNRMECLFLSSPITLLDVLKL